MHAADDVAHTTHARMNMIGQWCIDSGERSAERKMRRERKKKRRMWCHAAWLAQLVKQQDASAVQAQYQESL